MAVISYPTVGNCSWSGDLEFTATPQWNGADGTNRPNIPGETIVYALVSKRNSYGGTLKCGVDSGTTYAADAGFNARTYVAEAEASGVWRDAKSAKSSIMNTYFSSADQTTYRLMVTADGWIHKRNNFNFQFNDFAAYIKSNRADWATRYPWLTLPTREIRVSGWYASGQASQMIYRGRWDDISNRIKGQRRDWELWLRAKEIYDNSFPKVVDDYYLLYSNGQSIGMYNDQSETFYYPAIVTDVCYISPVTGKPTNDGLRGVTIDTCKFTQKVNLPGNNKNSSWKLTEGETFQGRNFVSFSDQYGNTANVFVSNPSNCEFPRVTNFDPVYGGDECKCAEGLLECKDKNGNVCCVDCCEVGKEVFHIMQGLTTL